jgi:hypothetical protein
VSKSGNLVRRDPEEEMEPGWVDERVAPVLDSALHSELPSNVEIANLCRDLTSAYLLLPAPLIPSPDHLRLSHKETILLVVGVIPRR